MIIDFRNGVHLDEAMEVVNEARSLGVYFSATFYTKGSEICAVDVSDDIPAEAVEIISVLNV